MGRYPKGHLLFLENTCYLHVSNQIEVDLKQGLLLHMHLPIYLFEFQRIFVNAFQKNHSVGGNFWLSVEERLKSVHLAFSKVVSKRSVVLDLK